MKKSDLKEGASFYVQNAAGKEPSIFGGTVTGEVVQTEEGMIIFNAKDSCSGNNVPVYCIMDRNGDILHAFSFRPFMPTLQDAFINGLEELALEASKAEALMESIKERQKAWTGDKYRGPDGRKVLLKPMR